MSDISQLSLFDKNGLSVKVFSLRKNMLAAEVDENNIQIFSLIRNVIRKRWGSSYKVSQVIQLQAYFKDHSLNDFYDHPHRIYTPLAIVWFLYK